MTDDEARKSTLHFSFDSPKDVLTKNLDPTRDCTRHFQGERDVPKLETASVFS